MRLAPLAWILAGCAGWTEPPADYRPRGHSELPRYLRSTATVDIQSPWISGTFTAAVAARTGDDPAVRLQLLPDLGGKALDLLARPDRVTGSFPHTGERIDWRLPDDARAHPLFFIAITLLEEFGPAADRRVIAVRPGEARLRPVVPGTRVELRDTEDGGSEKRISWGAARWTYAVGRSVEAPDLRIRVGSPDHRPAGPEIESLLK